MSGKGSKNKKKPKKQARVQNQNTTADTGKPAADKSEAIDVEALPAASESQSPEEKQVEAALAAEPQESAAVSEMIPTKADNKPGSPVLGSALAFGNEQVIEKTETTEGGSPTKLTISEEKNVKSDAVTLTSPTPESDAKVEVKDNERNESHGKTVDHQDRQPSDKTEDDMMSDTASKETKQNKDAPKFGSPALMVKSPEMNKVSPSKDGSTQSSVQGKSPYNTGDSFTDRKRQDASNYYGTRQATIMKERGEITVSRNFL